MHIQEVRHLFDEHAVELVKLGRMFFELNDPFRDSGEGLSDAFEAAIVAAFVDSPSKRSAPYDRLKIESSRDDTTVPDAPETRLGRLHKVPLFTGP